MERQGRPIGFKLAIQLQFQINDQCTEGDVRQGEIFRHCSDMN